MAKKKKKRLKVGSKIIERGKVYRIFKIERKKANGKQERIIHYRPYYKTSINDTVSCSIPEENLFDSGIRLPVTKTEVKEVIESLSKRIRKIKPLDTTGAKNDLKLNDIYKTSRILKRYWKAKNTEEINFSKTKKDVLRLAMERMVEEIAFVSKIPVEKAEEKISGALKN